MRQFPTVTWLVRVMSMLMFVAMSTLAITAQEAATPGSSAPDLSWQASISGQIEAFRRGDGNAALTFAGTMFKIQYRERGADAFVEDIRRSGYGPIVESLSHSFGDYRIVEGSSVLQVVNLQGPKQGRYQALYQLRNEPDGWRIQSVMLRRQPGIGV